MFEHSPTGSEPVDEPMRQLRMGRCSYWKCLTAWLLMTFAGACALASANSNGTYIETLAGVRTGAVSDHQRLANSAIINRHLSLGEHLRLHQGTRLEIGRSLTIGSGGSLIGDPGASKPTIFMPASTFNNRSDSTNNGRYAPNAVGIDFSGDSGGTYRPSTGVKIENIRLLSDPAMGRRLRGILGLNVSDCLISNVEIADFPMAIGVALSSARRCRITDLFVHDFMDNTEWPTLPQSTGIEIDNDVIHGVPSSENRIDHFRIERLRVGGRFLAKWGYQTDGINLLTTAAMTRIEDGTISDVGEGIDTFASGGTITRVAIRNAYIFGLKFIHGASRNHVSDVTIDNAGLAGVIFAGSNETSRNTSNNVITNIRISGIDRLGSWKGHSTAGILVSGENTRGLPVDNEVDDARIDLGPNGKYGWLDDTRASGNRGVHIAIRKGAGTDRAVLVLHHGSSVQLRSQR